jgi:hypothetical protein
MITKNVGQDIDEKHTAKFLGNPRVDDSGCGAGNILYVHPVKLFSV